MTQNVIQTGKRMETPTQRVVVQAGAGRERWKVGHTAAWVEPDGRVWSEVSRFGALVYAPMSPQEVRVLMGQRADGQVEVQPIVVRPLADRYRLPLEVVRWLGAVLTWNRPTEAGVIYGVTGKGKWVVVVPQQTVSGAEVEFKDVEKALGVLSRRKAILVGTVHTHPGWVASPSSTDKTDLFKTGTVHWVVGRADKPGQQVEVACWGCLGGVAWEDSRLTIEPLEVVDIGRTWRAVPSSVVVVDEEGKRVKEPAQLDRWITRKVERWTGARVGVPTGKPKTGWLWDMDEMEGTGWMSSQAGIDSRQTVGDEQEMEGWEQWELAEATDWMEREGRRIQRQWLEQMGRRFGQQMEMGGMGYWLAQRAVAVGLKEAVEWVYRQMGRPSCLAARWDGLAGAEYEEDGQVGNGKRCPTPAELEYMTEMELRVYGVWSGLVWAGQMIESMQPLAGQMATLEGQPDGKWAQTAGQLEWMGEVVRAAVGWLEDWQVRAHQMALWLSVVGRLLRRMAAQQDGVGQEIVAQAAEGRVELDEQQRRWLAYWSGYLPNEPVDSIQKLEEGWYGFVSWLENVVGTASAWASEQ